MGKREREEPGKSGKINRENQKVVKTKKWGIKSKKWGDKKWGERALFM